MDIPSKFDDVIDSRDVIARIEKLQVERETLVDELDDAEDDGKAERQALREWEDDNAEELAALEALQRGAEGYLPDWRHGVILIRDDYFDKHAREEAENLHGKAIRGAQWPFSCIDWEQAADELKQNYTAVDYDGVTYWVR